jgi:purine-binding chemotaxis protein CheW
MKMNGETTLSTIPQPERPVRLKRRANGAQVDWEAIRRKVLESSARLAWEDDVPPDILEQIWARRATQIAPAFKEEETGEQIEIVVVRLGMELYGMEAKYVFDIRPLDKITRVPRVPAWVAGVVNLRGRVISVLDLQLFLGLPVAEKKDGDEPVPRHLVLVETSDMEVALLVDEVIGIQNLPLKRIQDVDSAERELPAEYLRGIYLKNEAGGDTATSLESNKNTTLFMILNLSALLADKHLIVQEEII